jgi:hypothetical protein
MEAYEKGADGKLAIWASKTYQGHCMPPKDDILAAYNRNNHN